MEIENSVNRKLKMYGAGLLALLMILVLGLASLTLGKGQEYTEESEKRRTKKITISGQRGEITDRNGVVLANNRKTFGIQFSRDVSKNSTKDRAMYTQSLIKAVSVIEENGGKVISNFNLKKNEIGEFYFDFNTDDQTTFEKREKLWRENFYVNEIKKTAKQSTNILLKIFTTSCVVVIKFLKTRIMILLLSYFLFGKKCKQMHLDLIIQSLSATTLILLLFPNWKWKIFI